MANSIVSINLVVLNGEKYIRRCLESILAQSYPHENIEINILDNGSTDNTKSIISNFKFKILNSGFAKFNFVESKLNFGMWIGQEELLNQSEGKYVVVLSVDVILEKDFILNTVRAMDNDLKLGAIQGKIYQFNVQDLEIENFKLKIGGVIDTCGFKIDRSRRIKNIGHGEPDRVQFGSAREIFGVEGAVPIFRKEALESIRVFGEIADHDLFWYGEDLDVAWRIHLAGWKQMFIPNVIAWHDRGTTKGHTKGSWFRYIGRVGIRQQIPIQKRRLEWRNSRWTRIKNDYIINIFKDLPFIIWREIEVLGYAVLFEPGVLKEIPRFFRGIPRMLQKRREIMKHAQASPAEIHSYFL